MSKRILVVGATGVAGSAYLDYCRGHSQKALAGDAPGLDQLALQSTEQQQLFAVSRKPIDQSTSAANSTQCNSKTSDAPKRAFTKITNTASEIPERATAEKTTPEKTTAETQLTTETWLTADLLGNHDALRDLQGITHVVFAGFVPAPDFQQQVAPNRDILANCLSALSDNPLQRIVLIQGMKYYGSHLGPFKTPAHEDDPRHSGDNYYYAQQDILEASGIDWTCLRPHVICGTTSVGTPQNILWVIGVYAALMKHLGRPLCWPGTPESFSSINQATDSRLLASAIQWAIDTPAAANQAFNITNGDFFRWENLWPKIALLFDMPTGPVTPTDLSKEMPQFAEQWAQLQNEQQLAMGNMNDIVNWPFADYILRTGWDVMANTIKARQHGFDHCLDTESMYVELIESLQDISALPR